MTKLEYKEDEEYMRKFFYPLVDKSISIRKTAETETEWEYMDHIMKSFLVYDNEQKDNTIRELLMFYVTLVDEKYLREVIREQLKDEKTTNYNSQRYEFFINFWEPYLFDQTYTLFKCFTQGIDEAIAAYVNSLTDSWIWQIRNKNVDKNVELNRLKEQLKTTSERQQEQEERTQQARKEEIEIKLEEIAEIDGNENLDFNFDTDF